MANKALVSLGAAAACSNVGGSSSEQIPNNAIDANGSSYVLVPTSGDITAQWLKVDLGAAFLIHKYRVTFVNSTWTPTSWRIESSVDGNVWISRHYKPSWDKNTLDSGTLALFQATTARYWRIRPLTLAAGGTGMGPVSFELDDATGGTVETDPEDGVGSGGYSGPIGDNLALTSLGASATHNRTIHQGTQPGAAIDGNTGTYTLILNPSGQWLRVDLGAAACIGAYQVEWINSSWYSSEYVIESSVDDATWEERHHASGQNDTGTSAATPFNGSGAEARYWRIRSITAPGEGMGPTVFALHEGEDPGPPAAAPPKFRTNVRYTMDGSGESVTVTTPPEITDGELLLVVVALQPARANYPSLGHTPTGWTVLSPINSDQAMHAYWKVWHSGDPTSYTFSYFGGALFGVAQLLVYRLVSGPSPVSNYVANLYQSTATPSTSTFDPTDWPGSGPARLVMAHAAAGGRPRTVTTGPSSSTLVAQQEYVTNLGSMQVWDRLESSKTSIAAYSATYSASQECHALAILLVPEEETLEIEGAASADATATVSATGEVQPGSTAGVTATATMTAAAVLQLGGTATLEAVGAVAGQGALATQAEGQPLVATVTISGSLALVMVAAADPLLAAADVEGDGLFAIPGAVHIIATFDFELLAGVIRFAEGDIYAFGELENVLFARVRRKAAGSLEPLFDATLAGFVRMAASGSATGSAEITRAVGGRERRDAPTLLAQAMAMLAGRSGPGGHAVVFPSAVVTGTLVQGTVAETDITAEGRIEDFAPGAVVIRIASASAVARATTAGIARRDTSSAGSGVMSGAMIGDGGLLQRATSDPEASGTVELNGALIAVGGAGTLAAPVLSVGDARRTIYDNRHLHVDVTMIGTGRRETFAVSGLEGAGVNVVATGGYEQRATTAITALGKLNEPIAGFVKAGAGSLAVSATATLSGAELGSAGALAVAVDIEGSAPLSRIAAGDLAATVEIVGEGGYQRTAEAMVDAAATVEPAGSVALGASASLSVLGLVLATVAPFQIGEGALMAEVSVAESGATRLLGSRIFIHAEAFVWPRGGFPSDGAASVSVGAAITASAA